MHELDRGAPLDHLESELVLAAQAQRRAIQHADWHTVHFTGEAIMAAAPIGNATGC